jgi:hypothetical protein
MPKAKKQTVNADAAISLRPAIRKAIRAAGRPLDVDAITGLIPGARGVDVADAVRWNFTAGLIQNEFSHELQRDLYTLTARGLKS